MLLTSGVSYLIWCWYKGKSAAERLRDFRDRQCDPALAAETAPAEEHHDEPAIALPSAAARDTALRRHVLH